MCLPFLLGIFTRNCLIIGVVSRHYPLHGCIYYKHFLLCIYPLFPTLLVYCLFCYIWSHKAEPIKWKRNSVYVRYTATYDISIIKHWYIFQTQQQWQKNPFLFSSLMIWIFQNCLKRKVCFQKILCMWCYVILCWNTVKL